MVKTLKKYNSQRKSTAGFTLMETTVVIGLIAIISIVAIGLINPTKQLQKSWDSQRKTHLAYFQRIFNDYYNDHNSYPSGAELCYDQPVNNNGICTCSVCGVAGNNNSLKPYTARLGCDPEFSHKKYLYQFDCSQSVTQWYRVCAQLSENTIVKNSDGTTNYNYEITSGNIDKGECNTMVMQTSNLSVNSPTATPVPPSPTSGVVPSVTNIVVSLTPTSPPTTPSQTPVPLTPSPTPLMCQSFPGPKYCFNGPNCNLCGSVAQCNIPPNCDNPSLLFLNPTCQSTCSQ
jgi:type II secretory pathway pseudopilin PulG